MGDERRRRADDAYRQPTGVGWWLAVVLGFGALVATPGVASEPIEVHRRFLAMDTELEIRVWAAERDAALTASEAAFSAVESVESELSVWREDTALSRLNRSPLGVPVELPASVVASLERTLACTRQTRGGFDPSLGASPGRAAFSVASPVLVVKQSTARLDSGGFAKGEGLDRAVEVLREGTALGASLSLGGQISHFAREAGTTWEVDLAHPADRRRAAFTMIVGEGSVATSAQGERGPHIVDPHTGSAAADFGSLTVLVEAGSVQHPGFWADCLATGLFVGGPRAALEAAHSLPGVEAVVLLGGPEGVVARITAGLENRVRPRVEGSRVVVFESGDSQPEAITASSQGE